MKSTWTLILFCLFVAENTSGQTAQLGVSFGCGFTSFYSDKILSGNGNPRFGSIAAIGLNLSRGKLLLSTGVNYERKGDAFLLPVGGNLSFPYKGEAHFKRNLDYVTVPVMVGIQIGEKTKFGLNTGVFIGKLVHQKDIAEFQGEKTEWDYFENWHGFDFGIVSSISCQFFLVKDVSLEFGVLSSIGLFDQNKPGVYNTVHKHQSYLFKTGLLYSIRK